MRSWEGNAKPFIAAYPDTQAGADLLVGASTSRRPADLKRGGMVSQLALHVCVHKLGGCVFG